MFLLLNPYHTESVIDLKLLLLNLFPLLLQLLQYFPMASTHERRAIGRKRICRIKGQ